MIECMIVVVIEARSKGGMKLRAEADRNSLTAALVVLRLLVENDRPSLWP